MSEYVDHHQFKLPLSPTIHIVVELPDGSTQEEAEEKLNEALGGASSKNPYTYVGVESGYPFDVTD